MRAASPQPAPARIPSTAPLVDAIIICHNYGRFLGEAIDSVLAQRYPELEVVVVDDGSTDDTAEVAARYADRGVRCVHRPQGGAGRARNTGMRATSAPLIAFLDADDAWLPDRVAAGVAHLERHPEIALVAAHAFACDEAMRPSSIVHALRGPASGRMLEALLVHNVVLNPSSVLVRRSALEAAGGFSEIPFGEDWDTWIEIAKRFPIGFIDRPLALVRRHEGSVSPTSYRDRLDNHREIVERHLSGYRPAWRKPVIRRRAASVAYFHAGVGTAKSGNRRLARRYAVTAAAMDPVTLGRRKAKLLARVFLPERAVTALRSALGPDHRFTGRRLQRRARGHRA
jgi:glycosyltransferase involved in cell wall biosynthesis